MKNLIQKSMRTCCVFAMIITSILFNSCDNDDDSPDCTGIDCLPPITQTGAGTFGCLVNGEPYIDISGNFNCFYQNIDGINYFNISPNFERKFFLELDMGANKIDFEDETEFDLMDSSDGGGRATFFINVENRDISTTATMGGICRITNFDTINNIISGTFEFQIFDEQTQTLYQVTDGRFDSTFTR